MEIPPRKKFPTHEAKKEKRIKKPEKGAAKSNKSIPRFQTIKNLSNIPL